MNILTLIGRVQQLFAEDIAMHEVELNEKVKSSRFLVIGGAGSIGQAVVKEIFKRNPLALHVVDISENNLVELVRDIRSSLGYIDGDFQTLPLDVASMEFECFAAQYSPYDYILNLSALKHVRSEKDPFTLMRLIDVNIFNTIKTIQMAIQSKSKKYFAVSTDKAANPVNMMGASKRIMEHFLMRESEKVNISTARFANVAFSDGSLLHGFNQRMIKSQPITAPNDVKRYFVTPEESGVLCLFSTLLGENRDVFFPKLNQKLHLITFSEIAIRYLNSQGYEPVYCSSEEEARIKVNELSGKKKWPVYFFKSDTTGEKDFEEFYTENEEINLDRFVDIGIVKSSLPLANENLDWFENSILEFKKKKNWSKEDLVELFKKVLPEFYHEEKGKNLDQKM